MIRLGEKLYQERTRKGLTLEEVAKATRIRMTFLSSIEKSEYSKLPSSAYAYGFARNYIHYLGLPEDELLALFRREYGGEREVKVLPESFAKSQDFPLHKIKFDQTVKIILVLCIIFLGYIGFQYRYAIFAPSLEVLSPKENAEVLSQVVTVEGKTDPNSIVFVNSDSASVDDKGYFKKTVAVFSGKTTITVKAVSHFGKEKIIDRHIEVRD